MNFHMECFPPQIFHTFFHTDLKKKNFHITFNGPKKFHTFVERFHKTATLSAEQRMTNYNKCKQDPI